MNQASFGSLASGKRLERILASPNYKKGQFQNLHNTPSLTEGETYTSVLREFFFTKKPNKKPGKLLPSVKHDLSVPDDNDYLIWFGHSSYLLHIEGKTFLIDPVFSGHASPVNFTTPAFPGADVYTAADMPAIDYLVISHDHWDHLDFSTLTKLKGRFHKIITGLGVGAHLERWGIPEDLITELDWNEGIKPEASIEFTCLPARHFSGRGLKRNKSLWSSFALKINERSFYLGGDSGYDDHFKKIGNSYGPFELALLENGQYDRSWKYIHMMPEEVVDAAIDLKARFLLPVHWGKFSLGNHEWNEPIKRIVAEAKKRNVNIVHPLIGEKVYLRELAKNRPQWWESLG